MISKSVAMLEALALEALTAVKAPIFQPTRGYTSIRHRSQKKLRRLARQRGGK